MNLLRNQKLAKEAEEIDNYAKQRDIINLFKSMKSGIDTLEIYEGVINVSLIN